MVPAVVQAVLGTIDDGMAMIRIAPFVEVGMVVHALIGTASRVVAREGLEGGQKLPETAILGQRLLIPHLGSIE